MTYNTIHIIYIYTTKTSRQLHGLELTTYIQNYIQQNYTIKKSDMINCTSGGDLMHKLLYTAVL